MADLRLDVYLRRADELLEEAEIVLDGIVFGLAMTPAVGGCVDTTTLRPVVEGAADLLERIRAHRGTATEEASLRAENERLREALDNLAEAAHEFSILADYTVAESVEADFVAALDDAIALLRRAG